MHHEFCTGKETLKMNDTWPYFLTISEHPSPKVKELGERRAETQPTVMKCESLPSVRYPSVPGEQRIRGSETAIWLCPWS